MAKLVLLPGMDGTSELFAPFVAALPQDFESVPIRYPGDRFLTYTELEVLVRSACPASEPFFLVAESFSCPIAIQYAATGPEMLKGLILCSGFSSSPVPNWRHIVSTVAPLVFRIRAPEFAIRRWLTGPDASPALVSKVQTAISSVHPDVLSSRLRAVIAHEGRFAAGRITVPVLYIRGNQDRVIGVESLEELQRAIPALSVAKLDGPHLILQSKPQQAAEEVVRFFRSSGSN